MNTRPETILIIAPTPFFSNRGCHIRIYNKLCNLSMNSSSLIMLSYPHGSTVPLEHNALIIKRFANIFPFYKKITPGYDIFRLFFDILLPFWALWAFFRYRPSKVFGFLHSSIPALALIRFIGRLLRTPVSITLDIQDDIVHETVQKYRKTPWFLLNVIRTVERYALLVPNEITVSREELLSEHPHLLRLKDSKRNVSIHPDTAHPGIIFRKRVFSKGHRVTFLYTGNFTEEKGLEYIFSFFTAHRFKYSFRVILAGSGNQQLIKRLLLRYRADFDIVHPLRYTKLPSVLDKGDIGIEPKSNTTEGSGKVINYLAAGMFVLMHASFYDHNKSWLEPHRDRILFFENADFFTSFPPF